jgi:hypothetical protein
LAVDGHVALRAKELATAQVDETGEKKRKKKKISFVF